MSDTTISGLVTRAHANAKAKGFHDKPKPIALCLALIRTELAEAIEADRGPGKFDLALDEKDFWHLVDLLRDAPDNRYRDWAERLVQEARFRDVGEELADALIRVFDLAGAEGIDLEQRLNHRFPITDQSATLRQRQQEAGTYMSVQIPTYGFAGWLEHVQEDLTMAFKFQADPDEVAERLAWVTMHILAAAQWLGIDLEAAVLAKMARNEARPRMHGKAY